MTECISGVLGMNFFQSMPKKRREGGYTEIQVHSWDQNWRSTARAETQLSFAQFAQRFRIEIRGTARTCGQRFTVLASCNKQCQRHSSTKSTLTFRSQHLGESILCCAANPPWKTPKKDLTSVITMISRDASGPQQWCGQQWCGQHCGYSKWTSLSQSGDGSVCIPIKNPLIHQFSHH